MKKALSFLLVFAVVLSIIPMGMFTAGAEHKYLLTISTGNAAHDAPKSEWRYAVRAGAMEKMPTHVVIPSKIDGVIVSEVESNGFYDAWYIQSVTVPGSVQTIGSYAFYSCNALKKVTLNKGLKTIGESAFDGCFNLTSINIPDGVETIGDYAFYECDALKSITIPSSVTEFGYDVFYDSPVTVCCHSGSEAEKYAKENGVKYKNVHFWKLTGKTKASTTKNGLAQYKCTECGKTKKETVYKPKTYKLSKTAVVYSGSAKKPTIKIYDTKGKLIPASNYTVTYKNNVKIGKATVKITFKGFYKGTKNVSFQVVPKTTYIQEVKLSGNKKSAKVTLKKQTKQVSGYQIQYSTSSSFKNAKSKYIKNPQNKSVTLKGLNAKKTYYIRVRTYKKIGNKRYNAEWSTVMTSRNKPLLPKVYKTMLKTIVKQFPKNLGDYFGTNIEVAKELGQYTPTLSNLKYLLYDINKDGIYELILSSGAGNAIYTIHNDKAVCLIGQDIERESISVCADGTIYHSAWAGGPDYDYSVSTIQNGKLKTKKRLSRKLVETDIEYRLSSGNGEGKVVSEQKANAFLDSIKEATLPSFTTFKAFKNAIK